MFDHPLHPLFVHFTVALTFSGIGAYFLSYFIPWNKLTRDIGIASLWMIFFAGMATIFTIATGFLQFNAVQHDALSHLAMVNHRNWAIGTATILLGCVLIAINSYSKGKVYSLPLTLGLIILAVALSTTAFKGGNLVYRYGLGVKSTPALRELERNSNPKPKHDNLLEMETEHQH